ncbi:MAG: hypothetical protein ACFHHU_13820 [Porticoccaceae bacterium]
MPVFWPREQELTPIPGMWLPRYLPLLRQRRYYSTLEHGFARGNEPVVYVENIYRFKGILEWYIWQRDLDIENMFVESGVELEQPRDAYQGISGYATGAALNNSPNNSVSEL